MVGMIVSYWWNFREWVYIEWVGYGRERCTESAPLRPLPSTHTPSSIRISLSPTTISASQQDLWTEPAPPSTPTPSPITFHASNPQQLNNIASTPIPTPHYLDADISAGIHTTNIWMKRIYKLLLTICWMLSHTTLLLWMIHTYTH